MEEIPTRIALLEELDLEGGLKLISMVENPAIGFTQITMSGQEEKEYEIKLSIEDEEERIFFTPVLIPNQKIYREMQDGTKFNLVFPAETIKHSLINYSMKGRNAITDINHDGNELKDKVVFFEYFLKDQRRAKSVNGFDELPDGTLFVSGKVLDENIWSEIKAGKLNGVSIDGLFKTAKVEEIKPKMSKEEAEEVLETIKRLYN